PLAALKRQLTWVVQVPALPLGAEISSIRPPADGVRVGATAENGKPNDLQRVKTGSVAREPARRGVRVRGVGPTADEGLLRALYSEHGGPLFGYVLRLTGGDRSQAEDVVQETLLRAWKHPESLVGRPVRPWLFTVARNLVVDA